MLCSAAATHGGHRAADRGAGRRVRVGVHRRLRQRYDVPADDDDAARRRPLAGDVSAVTGMMLGFGYSLAAIRRSRWARCATRRDRSGQPVAARRHHDGARGRRVAARARPAVAWSGGRAPAATRRERGLSMPSYRVTVRRRSRPRRRSSTSRTFDNIRDWDPSVASARRLDEGGLRHRLDVRGGGAHAPARASVAPRGRAARPGSPIALEAQARWFRSYDVISVASAGEGSVATYDALLELKGVAKAATPLVGRAFRKLGDAAAEGLRRELA